MRAPRLLLAVTLLVSISGCPGKDAADNAKEELLDTVPVDGFLLVGGTNNGGGSAIHLVDPTTGKTAAIEFYVDAMSTVAISPDGQRIAWAEPLNLATLTQKVAIAEPTLENGVPALHILREIENVRLDQLHWNPDGDRLYSRNLWMNPATGDVHTCEGTETVLTQIDPIIPLDGHRYICNDARLLYDDGRYLSTVPGGDPQLLTADGQFFQHSFHTPSGTLRYWAPETDYDPGWTNAGRRLALPDGRHAILPWSKHGMIVVEDNGGFVTLYSRVEVKDPPPNGGLYNLAHMFQSGTVKAESGDWKVTSALTPWFNKGEGRRYDMLGVLADGKRAIYGITSHKIQAATDGTNVLYEVPVSSAFVEVGEDGTTRGFLTDDLTGHGFALPIEARIFDLGNGDWLATGGVYLPLLTNGLFGYVKGKPAYFGELSDITPDGRWLTGTSSTAHYCFRELTGHPLCLKTVPTGGILGIVGQGFHSEYANSAPMITGLSRTAAWPGETVVIFGAHFGTTGTVKVGDATVPSNDITSWSEHFIAFKMSTALPQQGRVHVTTSAGTGGDQRNFVLTRTELVTTPFDHLKAPDKSLKQGMNLVDLGDPPDFIGLSSPFVLKKELRDDQGRFLVFSPGDDSTKNLDVTLISGDFRHDLRFTLEPGLIDDTQWEPFQPTSVDLTLTNYAMTTLAGDLVERSTTLHPIVSSRMKTSGVADRFYPGAAAEWGYPDFFRNDGAKTWISNDPDPTPTLYGWNVHVLTGFTDGAGAWGVPKFATSPSLSLPLYFQGVAAHGDTVLFTGQDPMGIGGGAYHLSTDGGITKGTFFMPAESVLPNKGALREPVYVDAATPFFLVFEASYYSPQVLGVHAISPTGVLTPNLTSVPTGAQLNGGTIRNAPTLVETQGGVVLFHFGGTRTLVRADFDTANSWSVVPSASDAQHVRNMYRDPATNDLYVLKDDGSMKKATAAGKWNDWTDFDLGLHLPIPTRFTPVAAGKIPDGRWIVLTKLQDGAPGAAANAESPLGNAFWMIGPRP